MKSSADLWITTLSGPMMPTTYDAQLTKRALMQIADNIGPDQRVHLCSLIWAFNVRRHILQYPQILWANNDGPNQPAFLHCPQINYKRALFMHSTSYVFYGDLEKIIPELSPNISLIQFFWYSLFQHCLIKSGHLVIPFRAQLFKANDVVS